LNKKYAESSKLLKDKDDEILSLKKRISELEKGKEILKKIDTVSSGTSQGGLDYSSSNINVLSTQSPIKEEPVQRIEETDKSTEHTQHILSKITLYNHIQLDINKKIVEDLEALYFFDKVKMRPSSVTPKVPKLQLNFNMPAKQVKKINQVISYLLNKFFSFN
jgi:hypothetical protein